MCRPLFSIFKFKFSLTALFRWHRGYIAVPDGIAQDRRSELLVHQDPGAVLREPLGQGQLESVVDHFFGLGDSIGLLRAQYPAPSIESLLEGTAMIIG